MTKIIGVRFRNVGKIYYFSPLDFEIYTGDHVIVETARGVEYGTVVLAPREVEDDKIVLKKYLPQCVFCGSSDDLTEYKDNHICQNCLNELKS